jgi:hypothetical protein
MARCQHGEPYSLTRRPDELTRGDRRSLTRTITAMALGTLRFSDPGRVLKAVWPNDRTAAMTLQAITRAATPPIMTGDVPALRLEAVRVLPLLAPASAALQLFEHGIALEMGRLATIRIPNIGTIPPAEFITEGQRSARDVLGALDALPRLMGMGRSYQEGATGVILGRRDGRDAVAADALVDAVRRPKSVTSAHAIACLIGAHLRGSVFQPVNPVLLAATRSRCR